MTYKKGSDIQRLDRVIFSGASLQIPDLDV